MFIGQFAVLCIAYILNVEFDPSRGQQTCFRCEDRYLVVETMLEIMPKLPPISATGGGGVINRRIISSIGLGLVCMLDMFPSDVWLK